MINNYDRRQLTIMLDRLECFCSNKLSLHKLIQDLSSLLDALNDIDEEWKTDFRTIWLELEIVYAVMLDEEKNELNKELKSVVNGAVLQLKDLVLSLLSSSPIL